MGAPQKDYYVREKVLHNSLHRSDGRTIHYIPLSGGRFGVYIKRTYILSKLDTNKRYGCKCAYVNCTIPYNKELVKIEIVT